MTDINERVANALIPEDSEQSDERERITVRMSFFFDGTGNNRANTNARLEHTRANRKHGGDKTSYANDFSNVSLIEEHLDAKAAGYDQYVHVYVEGIGTENLKSDSRFPGQALGLGPAGIISKVNKGITEARKKLRELDYEPSTTVITKLTVDTCGFSRGAAAARYCVHRVLNDEWGRKRLQEQLRVDGWQVDKVEVEAVGLFDTVSAHGVVHRDDVFELKLNAISAAKHVLQLAAAEEYRDNFSLTNINSAGGKGRQVYLPGAHSDIGGGYVEGEDESKTLVVGGCSGDVAKFLTDRGWYSTSGSARELEHRVVEDPEGTSVEWVQVSRSSISRKYTYIPLRVMADFMKERGLSVKEKLYKSKDPGSIPARSAIEAYAKSKANSKPTDWEDKMKSELGDLRHGHLHVSFDARFGMGARLDNVGSWWSPEYRPSRRVYDG
jgi:hypothetical protein